MAEVLTWTKYRCFLIIHAITKLPYEFKKSELPTFLFLCGGVWHHNHLKLIEYVKDWGVFSLKIKSLAPVEKPESCSLYFSVFSGNGKMVVCI